MIRLLATRALQPDVQERAKSQGIELIAHEFVRTEAVRPEILCPRIRNYDCPAIFSSAQAVQAVCRAEAARPGSLKNRQCFCIEGKTARLARKNGLEVLATATDSAALAALIIAAGPPECVFYTAALHLPELPQRLRKAGIRLHIAEVYEKSAAPIAIDKHQGVLFFSPSQIASYLKCNSLPPGMPAFAIGETTAGELRRRGHKTLRVAPEASEESLIQTAIEYFRHEP